MSDSPWAPSVPPDGQPLQFSAPVKVWRVKRRISRMAVSVGLGLIVVPVILSLVSLVLWRVFGVFSAFGDVVAISGAGAWSVGAPLAAVVAFVASLRRRLRVDAAEVRGEELRLSGAGRPITVPRRAIDGALVVAGKDGGHEVEIALAGGDVLHVQAGGKEGELASALGASRGGRRTAVPLGGTRSPLWRGLRAVLLGLIASSVSACPGAMLGSALHTDTGITLFVTMLVTFLVTAGLIARPWAPRRVVIGADGVLIESAFGKRFFPRDRIFGVEVVRGRVALLLRDGDEVDHVPLTAEDPGRQDALIRRIRAALEAHGDGEDPRAALLARGDDSIAKWRERLGKLVAKGEGYRRRALPSDVLVRIASDGAAAPDVRLGAAMAIGLADDADARQQLRVAAEEVADDDLRAALEAVTEGKAEEEAVEAACARSRTWSTERR